MNKGTTETKTCKAMNSNRMRQPNHRGSIRKRGNKYEASVFINGTRYYFTTDTLEQAHSIIDQLVSSMYASSHGKKPARRTCDSLQSFAMNWLNTLSRLSPETRYGHERIVYLYIIPYFWDRLVANLTTQDIQEFVDALILEEKSAKTIKNIVSVLSGMLRYAVSTGILPYNPVRDSKIPSVHNIGLTDQFLDIDYYVLMNILTHTNVPYGDLYYTAITTGMRRGELLGLTWGDVDFENKTLYIHQQLQYNRLDKDGYYLKALKTYNAREVAFPSAVFERLAKIKAEQDQKRAVDQHFNPQGFVFTGNDGDHIRLAALDKAFRMFIRKHPELPQGARFHDLRGSFATHAFDIGVPAKTISYYLGHRSVEFTINRYMRSSHRAQTMAARQMDEDLRAFDGLDRQEIRIKLNEISMTGGL